jgi:hypothetical protein
MDGDEKYVHFSEKPPALTYTETLHSAHRVHLCVS